MRSKRRLTSLFLFTVLIMFLVATGFPRITNATRLNSSLAGPYVNKLQYRVIGGNDNLVEAILDDRIDLIDDTIPEASLAALEQSDDIVVSKNLKNSYGMFVINCEKYPLNITAFRRAAAFALDKRALSAEVLDGQSEPLDSCVPKINPLSVEGMLDYSYYDQQLYKGNSLLYHAGFYDVDGDGYREAPDGTSFSVMIEVDEMSAEAITAGEFLEEALQSLSIDARFVLRYYYEYLSRLYYHGDYDIAFKSMSRGEENLGVQWLAYEFASQYADVDYWNSPNFRNETYDYWADRLLYSVDYEDIKLAAAEMQKIWIYESPGIVCYEPYFCNAYRTDRFEGFVSTPVEGMASWWTNYRVYLKQARDHPFGGTLRISSSYDRGSTFNMFTLADAIGYRQPLPLYDTLITADVNGYDIPWLAESVMVQTHSDNPLVPEGYTRFRVDIVQNATWTDGRALTAEDVAFSFNYYRDAPGHPYGPSLSELRACYSMTDTSLIMEFESESYWHVHTISTLPIIPKHIFVEVDLEGWSDWSPNPPDEEMTTSGPFNVSAYAESDYLELVANQDYFRRPGNWPSPYRPLPTIQSSPRVIVPSDSVGFTLNWSIENGTGSEYTIYVNSASEDTGTITSSHQVIVLSLDSLDPGSYNCTIEVITSYRYTLSDTVWVPVQGPKDEGIEELSWLINPVSFAVTVASLLVIFLVSTKALLEHRT